MYEELHSGISESKLGVYEIDGFTLSQSGCEVMLCSLVRLPLLGSYQVSRAVGCVFR